MTKEEIENRIKELKEELIHLRMELAETTITTENKTWVVKVDPYRYPPPQWGEEPITTVNIPPFTGGLK
jgi:hypothetical protein